MSLDPVFQADKEFRYVNLGTRFESDTPDYIVGKWYFWIETWADTEGPFDTEAEARAALEQYVKELG